jgi:hypothetical protein
MALEVKVLDYGDVELESSFLVLGRDCGRVRRVPVLGMLILGAVQPVDQVFDVDRRVLRMHQAGHRVFQLAAVEDDRRVHGEEVVLRVQHIADVAEPQAVFLELVVDHGLVGLQPAHAERFHDLAGAVAGVDQDRPGTWREAAALDFIVTLLAATARLLFVTALGAQMSAQIFPWASQGLFM